VLCWLSLPRAPLPVKATPQVVQGGALKPATRTCPPTLSIKTLTRSKNQESMQSAHKSKHQRKNRKFEITKVLLTFGRVQMSHRPAHTRLRGSRTGRQEGSMAVSMVRLDLRVASGSCLFEPLQTLGFLIFLSQQQRHTAATSMTFHHR